MRLIDADEAIINFGSEFGSEWDDISPTRDEFVEFIKKQPTIEAEPIVRCKECIYWKSGENECDKWEHCILHNIGIDPNSFCSYGEREKGADNG